MTDRRFFPARLNGLLGALEDSWLVNGNFDSDGIDQGLTKELLSLYWKTANSTFLLVYRPAFMRDLVNHGSYFSRFLLNAIYYNACRHVSTQTCDRYATNIIVLSAQFHERFQTLLRDSFDVSSITTVQALLVMSGALAGVGAERNAAWLYSGIAFRMIFDLGLHTTTSDSLSGSRASSEDLEIRRRLFWSAFGNYQISNLLLDIVLITEKSSTSYSLSTTGDRQPFKRLIQW